jgi:hypothetical protein
MLEKHHSFFDRLKEVFNKNLIVLLALILKLKNMMFQGLS